MDGKLKEIIDGLSRDVYIISDEMSSKKRYVTLIDIVFDYLRAGFEVKELREAPVRYKFNQFDNERTMQLRHFLTNLIFWCPLVELCATDDICERYIIDTSKISSGYIENYLNTLIIDPYRNRVSNKKMNKILHDVIFNLTRISTDFNIILGLTINLETFIDVANNNPRFDEIIHTKLDESMQPKEIEKYLHDLMVEEIDILKAEKNSLQPMLKSGTGIKEKTLAELSISGGLKPDLSGKTMPIPINSNFITSGLSSVKNYYIDSMGGRKSLIANKFDMGKSGYFTKQIMMCSSNVFLSKSSEPCNTINPIQYEISSSKHLKRLRGRMYRTPYSKTYKVLTGNETELIGTNIYVRSPITCTSPDGCICKYCYGPILHHTNQGVDIGAYAGAIITNPLGQSILSTKHLLTTISELIEFVEPFSKFFTIDANEISINNALEDLDRYSLLIIDENIVTIGDLTEGEITDFVTIFHVKDNISGEIYEIYENNMKELYISPELYKILKLGKRRKEGKVYEIKFSDIPDEYRLFLFEIDNNELTKPLKDIMGLLNTKKINKALGIDTVDAKVQKLLDLLIVSGINVQAVHGELLIRPLIRSIDNILERPNFNKYLAKENSQILTISASLEKHPSALIGLSSAQLKKQIQSPLTFKKRGTSVVDPFFKLTLN